jgi:hypothetical protein
MEDQPCSYPGCSNTEDKHHSDYTPIIAKKEGYERLCYKCAFWLEQAANKTRVIIVGGTHYRYGGEEKSSARGFGGEKFTFRFLSDGSELTTTNLWHQGQIPDRFRHLMPDNAVSVGPKGLLRQAG